MVDITSSQSRIFRRQEISYSKDDDFLGCGGFGIVYRCRLPLAKSKEVAAVKVLNVPHRLRKIEENAFVREASILERLVDCPYIVRFLGLCIDPGHYAIVMEYVEYGNLGHMLVDGDSAIKQWDRRIHMALEIAKGMDYLHSLQPQIIHRDLKTTNVLVGHNYCCKIIDFGLARVRDISTQTTKSVKGTVAFTAPEIFDGTIEGKKEMKVDVYSYALVLWQLKEMKQLYANVSPAIIRVNVMAGQRPLLSDNDGLEEYREIIVRCWDGQPDCRPQFEEIVAMLDGIMSQMYSVHAVSANRDVVSSNDIATTTMMPSPDGDARSLESLERLKELNTQITQTTTRQIHKLEPNNHAKRNDEQRSDAEKKVEERRNEFKEMIDEERSHGYWNRVYQGIIDEGEDRSNDYWNDGFEGIIDEETSNDGWNDEFEGIIDEERNNEDWNDGFEGIDEERSNEYLNDGFEGIIDEETSNDGWNDEVEGIIDEERNNEDWNDGFEGMIDEERSNEYWNDDVEGIIEEESSNEDWNDGFEGMIDEERSNEYWNDEVEGMYM